MTDQIEIVAEERDISGKGVRRLRDRGMIPATMYGHNSDPLSLQVERATLQPALRRAGTSSLIRLRIGKNEPETVLIRQVQFHPVRGDLLHVDFLRVAAREKLRTAIPLRFVGHAPVAETHDVAIVKALDEVTVECYPADLPSFIEVELSTLTDTSSTLRVADLKVGPGVEIVTSPEDVLASVSVTAREAEEAAEAKQVEQPEEEAQRRTEEQAA